jgi:uncharacterized membrane protein
MHRWPLPGVFPLETKKGNLIVGYEAELLPSHIEETIHSIAKLQASHQEQASPLQRAVNRITAFVGHPRFLLLITAAILLWAGLNLALQFAGSQPFDPPPFIWLQGLLSLTALYIMTLIVATQRYAEELAGYREQLTLELAILAEQKTSKLIALLEEQRRDNPLMQDRADPEADAMGTSRKPEVVLDAIKEAHEEFNPSSSKTGQEPDRDGRG